MATAWECTVEGHPQKRVYEFDYGVVSFHEGCAEEHELRPLTKEEEQRPVWQLPQQFYQSGPPGAESMDNPLSPRQK